MPSGCAQLCGRGGIEDARLALHIALTARQSYTTGQTLPVVPLTPLGTRTPTPAGATCTSPPQTPQTAITA